MTTASTASRFPSAATLGRILGPVLALAAYAALGGAEALAPAARTTAAIAVLLATWWMTEALPLPVTSLVPLIVFPLSGALPLDDASAQYANRYIFLFMGGFMVARAVEKWNLHRRIALLTVLVAGARPRQLVAGFMLATGGLSMWLSNTAATVMMLPIGLSLVGLVRERLDREGIDDVVSSRNFATAMMLGIAYAASIGGVSTLIGTPTNLFLAGFAEQQGIPVGFGRWMLFATPLTALLLVVAWGLLTRVLFPIRITAIPGGEGLIRDQLTALGPVSRGERTVLIVFVLTAAAWVLREPVTSLTWLVERVPLVGRLDDTIIVMIAVVSLFLIPVDRTGRRQALDWDTAVRIPWGVLLLFGAGFCLAKAVADTGLAQAIGASVQGLPLSSFGLMATVTTLVTFLTELTSNTPTAATFLPILNGVADGVGANPMLLLAPATIAASCAFMLPVATPPNAIVFGSGHIEIRSMVKAGFWLNLSAIALVCAWMWLVGARIFAVGV